MLESGRRVEKWRAEVNAGLAERKVRLGQFNAAKTKHATAQDNLEAAEEARAIVQAVTEAIQRTVHGRIASIVSDCLQAVFDDPYEFRIVFEEKRGKTEARIVFVRDGMEYDDPMNQIGGGVIDVAAFALRLACLLLTRPPRRRVLLLDEPFRYIRGEVYRSRVAAMLKRLADDLNIQIVLNTDIPTFRLGTVVEMG